jgi:hypothetical protein
MMENPMRTLILSCAAALALLSTPALSPAFAQDNVRSDKTVQPHELATAKRAPLQVSDQQKNAIRDGLVAEHTQQKTPDGFQPKVGDALPKIMKVDVMPQDLIRREPSLKEYGYAKTASDILVLDPMTKKIIAVVPRKFPADAKAKAESPVDWAKTKGRELTGQQPEQGDQNAQPLQPAGDAGDVSNGNESNAREK